MRGTAMRGLPIEIDPGLPAMLDPSLLQKLYFVRRCNTEAIQGKDGRPHRDTLRALNQGFVSLSWGAAPLLALFPSNDGLDGKAS